MYFLRLLEKIKLITDSFKKNIENSSRRLPTLDAKILHDHNEPDEKLAPPYTHPHKEPHKSFVMFSRTVRGARTSPG